MPDPLLKAQGSPSPATNIVAIAHPPTLPHIGLTKTLPSDSQLLSQTESDEPGETEGGTFSPLPGDSEEAAPEAEDAPEPVEDAAPTGIPETLPPRPGAEAEAVPIPAEVVLDALEYLNPDPNPLLIQTDPAEVEIIGTQLLTLEQAIELAYRNNPDLQVAELELQQSREVLNEARAARLPTVSVSGALQGQNTTSTSLGPVGGGLGTVTTERLGGVIRGQLDVVYNVFSSGRRAASIRAAEESIRLQELELERRREVLRLNTINEYYDLQQTVEEIRISQAFLDEAERNLRDTRLREEVGVGTRFDVLRAEVQTANARQRLVQAQSDRQTAQRTLARRLNLPPSITVNTVPVAIAGNWPLSLEESIVMAYQFRAELEQQLAQREIGEQQRRIALSEIGPQVDLFANYSGQSTFTDDNGFNDGYQFGARVAWTLFDGGAAAARGRQREIDIAIAEERFEDTRTGIRLEIEQAYYSLQANQQNIQTAELAVEQAREALELAILRFEAGVGTQLDVISAQSELTDAEGQYIRAVLGYNRALAALERSVSNLPERNYEPLPY